jgi:hypothetical protein
MRHNRQRHVRDVSIDLKAPVIFSDVRELECSTNGEHDALASSTRTRRMGTQGDGVAVQQCYSGRRMGKRRSPVGEQCIAGAWTNRGSGTALSSFRRLSRREARFKGNVPRSDPPLTKSSKRTLAAQCARVVSSGIATPKHAGKRLGAWSSESHP